jgi:hypothetical protein
MLLTLKKSFSIDFLRLHFLFVYLQRQLSLAFGNEAEIEVAESAEEAWEIIEERAKG